VTSASPSVVERAQGRVPSHLAVVGLGAERWPGDPRTAPAALDRALDELVHGALDLGVRWLTVQEPTGGRALRRRAAELGARGVELRGPDGAVLQEAGLEPPVLIVMLSTGHSGREEIVAATRRLADEGIEKVDEEAIAARLWAPDVDLLVLTGGDRRVPDLLLWEIAYSEIVFLDDPWPDVGRDQLAAAVSEYRRRDRRYGGLVPST
jgi:undecaprenyl pyrophosphate synthase